MSTLPRFWRRAWLPSALRSGACLRAASILLLVAFGAAPRASAALTEQVFTDTLVLDIGQPNPHDFTNFTVGKFDPALGNLNSVTITLQSDFSGSVLFHGVHGEGYFHYAPRNFVESEITGVSNPPSPIVDNVVPTKTCHVGTGGQFDVACSLTATGILSDPATVTGSALSSYAGTGTFNVLVTQQDRSAYYGNFPPDPGGPAYTGLTFAPNMTSGVTLTVRYEFTSTSSVSGEVPNGNDVPGPALMVVPAAGGMITLTWSSSCLFTDDDFDVYEGTLGSFPDHAPVSCSTAGSTTATIAPGAGSRYYLVVTRNASVEGSYGRSRNGVERPPATTACLPQGIGACR